MAKHRITRRGFLGGSLSAAVAWTIVPRHVLGGPGRRPPSEVITRGVVGTGSQGTGQHVVANPEDGTAVCLAVCDVDRNHLHGALAKAGRHCQGYGDFREMLDRQDIDTIHIATPPHWHSLISIAAAQAGKDVLCEKPMTRFIAEGQAIADAVRRHGRVFQIGTYHRFDGMARRLRQLVDGGLLGSPLTVRIGKCTGYNWKVKEWSGRRDLSVQPVPAELDYDMWLGPAPAKPYHRHRVHGSFRGYWDYDGGGLADMAQHYLDPMQYILNKDHTSPVEVWADAPPPHPDAVGLWGRVWMKYADGTTIILDSGEWGQGEPAGAPLIEGPKGKVFGGREAIRISRTEPADLLDKARQHPEPPAMIRFEEAVRTRRQPGGNAEVVQRSSILFHLANIAIRTGRRLRFDPDRQAFLDDDEANRLVDVPMRSPWHL